ncbi:hypothetical protein JQV19_06735 [Sulfitobacter mediterraneus]|nr:hypothetical protein [Sulfitobacter mediterraneus]MBM1567617.1 hypothetical protein [Sulfitobacter mediterraneus]MBM1571699.1 hypothetical protein [Sulfitobacter mediterraneus]MBM1575487.1 hypothetical protein [Sulfitobacter mediterraneus]MBM1579022.1 hypothetical protein [Sulfitobacter mediterraneus]
MARLLLIVLFVVVIVAIGAIMLSIWTAATAPRPSGSERGIAGIKEDLMGSRSVRKMAYVALIVVLFGVTSGWLGGL